MIAKSWFSGCWHWTIGGLVGALSLGVTEAVLAQVVPDNTLGAEGSRLHLVSISGVLLATR